MKRSLFRTILLLMSSLLVIYIAKAQDTIAATPIPFTSIKTIFQELQNFDKLVIKTNLDSLSLNKRLDRDQPAVLSFYKEGVTKLRLEVQVEARGKYRRTICSLPPLKLKFAKEDLDSLGLFTKYDKLKLVTHCHEKANSEQIVLKEFWTYRMYNELSDNSFKVHHFEIIYQHTASPSRTVQNHAFIIENNEEMAHRIGGELTDILGIKAAELTSKSYHQALLFNYMIGNTDWKLNVQKNLKLVKHKNEDLLTLVPYDFDFAKFVDAPYMLPSAPKGIINEDNRYALGQFANEAALESTIQQFKKLRKTGFKCYKSCPILKGKEKGKMSYFMQTFFQSVRNDKRMKATFLSVE